MYLKRLANNISNHKGSNTTGSVDLHHGNTAAAAAAAATTIVDQRGSLSMSMGMEYGGDNVNVAAICDLR